MNRKLAKSILQALGGASLLAISTSASAVLPYSELGGLAGKGSVSMDGNVPMKAYTDYGVGNLGWMHTANFVGFDLGTAEEEANGVRYDVVITLQARGNLLQGLDNPSFSLWTRGTNDFTMVNGGAHAWNQLRGPNDTVLDPLSVTPGVLPDGEVVLNNNNDLNDTTGIGDENGGNGIRDGAFLKAGVLDGHIGWIGYAQSGPSVTIVNDKDIVNSMNLTKSGNPVYDTLPYGWFVNRGNPWVDGARSTGLVTEGQSRDQAKLILTGLKAGGYFIGLGGSCGTRTPKIDCRPGRDYTIRVAYSPSDSQNLRPSANAGPDQSVDGGATVTLNGGGADPDNDALTYHWVQTQGNAVTLGDPNAATPTFIAPVVATDTVLSFSLQVTDAAGLSSYADVTNVIVRNDNAAPAGRPSANAGRDQTVALSQVVKLEGSGSDPENQALTYQWTQLAGPEVALNNSTAPNPSFTAPAKTTDSITFSLVVTDADGQASAPDTVDVSLVHVNHLPQAVPTGKNKTHVGDTYQLGNDSFDPDDDPLSSPTWTQTAGNAVSLQPSATAEKPSFVVPEGSAGTTIGLQLVVSDPDSTSKPAVKTIDVVAANTDPVVDGGADIRVVENKTVTLAPVGSDVDEDDLTYHWEIVSGGGTLANADTAAARYTAPSVDPVGADAQLRVTVNDGHGGTASDTVNLRVFETLSCAAIHPSIAALSANSNFQEVQIQGVVGGIDTVVRVTGVWSDEPVYNRKTRDYTYPDAKVIMDRTTGSPTYGSPTDKVELRGERSRKTVKIAGSGNGRVYGVQYKAVAIGETCSGQVEVQVPMKANGRAVKNRSQFDATRL